MTLRHLLLVGMTASILALSGCGGDRGGKSDLLPVPEGAEYMTVAGETGKHGGALVIAAISDPKTFNPIVASETSSTEILDHMFAGLVERNGETMKLEPSLATKWTTSPDGRVWTFTLRQGLQWSDGQPLTADDVVFTFNELVYNPDVPNSTADVLTVAGKPIKVEKVDALTVRLSMDKPFAPLLSGLTGPILPRHKLQEAVKQKKFNSTWGIDTPPQEIVCSGPYVLNKYVPSQKVILSRNPYFWKMDARGRRLPYIDEWYYVVVPDLDAVLLKFQAGQTDVMSVRGADYAMVKKQEKEKNFTTYDLGPTFGTEMLFFNMNPAAKSLPAWKRAWFCDRTFRAAVAHAVDKKTIINTVHNGLAQPLWGPESAANKQFFNANVTKYPYDIERARSLLDHAGYKDRDGDGIIEDRAGRPVAFTIITNVENGERVKEANIIKDDLTRLGMKVNLAPISFNSLVTKLDRSFDWELCLLGFTGGPEPHSGRNFWHSSGQLHVWNPAQKKPATAWEARIDAIFEEAAVTLDPVKRKKLYDEYQALVADELPVVYLVTPTRKSAVRNRFGNLRPAIGGAIWNEWQIYVR